MQKDERSVALAALAYDLLYGKLSKTEYAQKRKELEAGSQKADLFPAGKVVGFHDYVDTLVQGLQCLARNVHGFAEAEIRSEIDHYKKVVDHELSFKGRGGFLTGLMEAFVRADLDNGAAMLPLMRYLEDKYRMEEGKGN